MRQSKVKTRGFWANRWEAAKRYWRRQPLEEWSAEMLPHGLRIERNSWARYRAGWREVVEFAWTEIERVAAYKTDEFAFDTIWLRFELQGRDCVAIPEDAPEWKKLIAALPKHLPGCLPVEAWYTRVSQPPFERNHTVVYGGFFHETKAD